MRSVPPRWRPLHAYLEVLLAPLIEAAVGPWFLVEAAGPDGGDWTDLEPRAVRLDGPDPARAVLRAVATLAGATAAVPEPGPERQRRRGIHYVPSAFLTPRRRDATVAAIGAIVLDVDDRDHGGREGVLRAIARAPRPTAYVFSGGGVHVVYVLREAIVLDRTDEAALTVSVRAYVHAAHALQAITDADDTAWPGHLFRCPGTFHLKNPSDPLLVDVRLDAANRFNLADFDELLDAASTGRVESITTRVVDRLLGRTRVAGFLDAITPIAGTPGKKTKVKLPVRVSPEMVTLLNTGKHPKYARRDGTLDRSRAVYSASLSLLGAGLDPQRVATLIASSALRSAIEDKGDDAVRWLGFQIDAAMKFLATAGTRGRS